MEIPDLDKLPFQDLPMARCPGCARPFGPNLDVCSWVDHYVNMTEGEPGVTATRYPLCEPCTRRYGGSCETTDDFVALCDARATAWIELHLALEEFRRGDLS